jgi:2-polyprenyl-6-methoxyphenol hydroxylase-like FAD-dependent oxidoreductase
MKIGIIGGGITGLTSALALHKVGISSIIYEQAEKPNEIGAGIWLQPNAIKILEWLGIKDDIKLQGVKLDKMEITNSKLIPIVKIKIDVIQDKSGIETIAIHRGKLQNILYKAVSMSGKVRLNKSYKNHSVESGSITIQFQDSQEKADLLLGADGIHSSVRQVLFPRSSLRNSRQVCWRGISKMELPAHLKNIGQEAWGRQIRFGFSRITDGEVYWFATAKEEHLKKADNIGRKEYLMKLFQDFATVIPELIAHTESSAIHQTILYDLKRLANWHKDSVCLLGDAAHATTPNMGQGACQGIEDAYYISRLLSHSKQPPESIFEEFQQKRRRKVDYIVNNSWRLGKMAHNAIGLYFLKLIIKIIPENVIRSQMEKLYKIEK